MKVSFEINSVIDVDDAIGQMLAVLDAFRLLEDPSGARKIPFQTAIRMKPEPVAEPPVADVPAPRRSRKPPPPVAEPATPVATAVRRAEILGTTPLSPEELRARLVKLCRIKGIAWVRETLTSYNRDRISDLSDDEVYDLLGKVNILTLDVSA